MLFKKGRISREKANDGEGSLQIKVFGSGYEERTGAAGVKPADGAREERGRRGGGMYKLYETMGEFIEML